MPVSDPSRELVYAWGNAIVPDDAGAFMMVTDALYVGGAGNLRVLMAEGTDVTFIGVLAGTIYPLRVTRVYATNTTATNIVRLNK